MIFLLVSADLYGRSKKPVIVESYKDKLYWGACSFASDPADTSKNAKAYPVVCLKPKISSSILIREDRDEKYTLHYSDIYAGVHLHRYLSAHGEWQKFRVSNLENSVHDETYTDYSITKKAFVQLGNNAVSKVRLAAGKMPMPFGLNYQVLPEIFNQVIKKDHYWDAPEWVGKLTIDNLVSSQYDVAYAIDKKNKDGEGSKTEDGDVLRAVSARMMFDIGALAGFRVILSGYGEKQGQRRMGVGFFTISENGDATSIRSFA